MGALKDITQNNNIYKQIKSVGLKENKETKLDEWVSVKSITQTYSKKWISSILLNNSFLVEDKSHI